MISGGIVVSRFVTGFFRSAQTLVCDGVDLQAIADAEGTPLYVYSAALIRERYRDLDEAFAGYAHSLHYALKANSNLAIGRLLHQLGSAADANSIWEIDVARRMGFARTRSCSPAWASRPPSSSRPCHSA